MKNNRMPKTVHYPRIYLAIDNCFGAKRWTKPIEWARVVKDLGLTYVEASADNECDPLYNGSEYMSDWVGHVRDATEQFGIKTANLYSGHGTYATLGLTHHDKRLRDRMQNSWLREMINAAGCLNSGIGFFCHAFDQATLNDSRMYSDAKEDLYSRLAQMAALSAEKSVRTIAVEQMYTPHQIPWTIEGSVDLLRQVYARSGHPFYITIDVGHQSHQKEYVKPNFNQIKEYLRLFREKGFVEKVWLGPKSAYQIFNKAVTLSGQSETDAIVEIIAIMQVHPHLFASFYDGDTYCWLNKLACWSPIVHLQQTNGSSSAHHPFTEEYNKAGAINPKRVLQEIAASYEQDFSETMPPVCKDIYLTLEIFFGTAAMAVDIIKKLEDTVAYWRKFIPVDGLSLESLLVKPSQDTRHKPIITVHQTVKNRINLYEPTAK